MSKSGTDPVSLVIVGMGGYGEVYLESLLKTESSGVSGRMGGEAEVAFEIVGAVDPVPQRCRYMDRLRAMGVPFFPSLGAFYQHTCADLAVISSPIHFHCAQTSLALCQGSHVLCEKPAAATVQEVDAMIRARDEAGRQVSIGYQWSFSSTIQRLKRDILDNRFGAPRILKNLCLWPRDASYYARNRWAGRKKTPDGAWILDSPVNNAMAHYLHNMLFLLGPTMNESATPARIQAELYRANPIENYDTAALRIQTTEGARLLFFCAHPIARTFGPAFSFEFEKATITCADQGAPVEIRFHDGSMPAQESINEFSSQGREADIIDTAVGADGSALTAAANKKPAESLPHPDADDQCKKLWDCMKAIKTDSVFPCPLEAASAQTICMNGAQESMPDAIRFPTSLIRKAGDNDQTLTWVEGLAEILETAWKQGKLLSEQNVSWAKSGRIVDLTGYNRFPSH